MNGLQQTNIAAIMPRADFDRTGFEVLIAQKGRRVLYEKAMQCPCKSVVSNQQSICRNCGGCGWIFINPKETRFVMHSMNSATAYKDWSEETRGMLNISASNDEQLAFMDRFTVLDSRAIFNEVLHFNQKNGTWFARSAYPIKKTIFAAFFENAQSSLVPLKEGVDFTISGDLVMLTQALTSTDGIISVSVRYYHAPVYYILELPRESMETFEYKLGEKLIRLPMSAVARRAHYVLDGKTLSGTILNSNNQIDDSACSSECDYSSTQTIVYDPNDFVRRKVVSFANQTVITITHNLNYKPAVEVYDLANNIIEASVVVTNTTATITLSQVNSGTVVLQGSMSQFQGSFDTNSFVKRRVIPFTNQTSLHITHNLNYKPIVTIYDSISAIIEADVQATPIVATINFSEPKTGIIVLHG